MTCPTWKKSNTAFEMSSNFTSQTPQEFEIVFVQEAYFECKLGKQKAVGVQK